MHSGLSTVLLGTLILRSARRFSAFCIERGDLTANPFEKLRSIDKISTGKTQLTADEARRFMNTALQRIAAGHPAALAAALQLALGLRSSEVLNRRVRDLDEGATVLLIPNGKTKNARRRPVIPPFLRSQLEALAANQAPDAYLFGAGQSGNPHMTSWLVREVRRICEQAAVPAVCPHSLRGLHATLAMREGVASHAVASALGHGSFSITARHYVDPTQLVNTRVAAVMTALGQDSTQDPKAALSEVATTLLDHFAADQLEDLITLLRSRKTA